MNTNQSIHSFFEEYALAHPDDVAIISGDTSLNYQELNHRANQLAHYLLGLGVTVDSPIAVCLERSIDFMITIMAILKAGGAYLPIDLNHPDERLLFILHDSNAPILITHKVLKNRFSNFTGHTVALDESATAIASQSSVNPINENTPQQLAYIIYTSGSTGTPKGVQIEHASAVNYCLWFADYSHAKAQERIDFSSNPNFDMAITLTLAPLMFGLTIVMCDEAIKRDVRLYLEHLKHHKVSCIKLTPSYFKVLDSVVTRLSMC